MTALGTVRTCAEGLNDTLTRSLAAVASRMTCSCTMPRVDTRSDTKRASPARYLEQEGNAGPQCCKQKKKVE